MKCSYDPSQDPPAPIGMYHCPECGNMVVSGVPHPDWDNLDSLYEEYLKEHPEEPDSEDPNDPFSWDYV